MAKYVLDLSREDQLVMVDGQSRLGVTRVYDSAVGKRHIIVIAADGTVDGKLYRVDQFGDSDNPLVALYEKASFEWLPSENNIPKMVVDTRPSDGRLRVSLTWPEGDVEVLVAAQRVAPQVPFPLGLPKRKALLLGRE